MTHLLAPPQAGWRGVGTTKGKTGFRVQLSDAWHLTCDPRHTTVAWAPWAASVGHDAARSTGVTLHGTVGAPDLFLDVSLAGVELPAGPLALAFRLESSRKGGADPRALLRRIIVRRHLVGPAQTVRLWRAEDGMESGPDCALPLGQAAENQLRRLLAGAAAEGDDEPVLRLTIAPGPVDLAIGGFAFRSLQAPIADKASPISYRSPLSDIRMRHWPERTALERARALRRQSRDPAVPAGARAASRQAAVEVYQGLPLETRTAESRLQLADLLYEEQQYQECLAELDRDEGAAGAAALNLRSRALIALGRFDEGLTDARRVLELDPSDAAAAFRLRAFRRFSEGETARGGSLPRRSEVEARNALAVAVGSGIGNLVHAGPLIRRLSIHHGGPVDVIVAEDYDDSLGLLEHPRYVGLVSPLSPAILRRRYGLVFVANSFGTNRVPFAADRVVWSRDWTPFQAGGDLHEAVFNLEAAKRLLDIDYDLEDAHQTLLKPSAQAERDPMLVGLHAGSKTGIWASKRWPHFETFAAALAAQGFKVASFGLSSEYVPGTLDRTGSSIAEMTAGLRSCGAFVANDSGVMNIANALGIPVLALFGPTNWRTRGPLGAASLSLPLVKACSPCECLTPQAFRAGGCPCMQEVSVEAVLRAFQALRRPAAPRPRDGVPRLVPSDDP